MKHIVLLSLFLFPVFLYAQYPTTGNKQRLGWQTTGDGLIWRGVAADTVYKPNNRNYPYFQLDTVNAVLYRYIATQGSWQAVGGSVDTSLFVRYTDRNYQISLTKGLISGGIVTINADPTKIDISAGTGLLVDDWTDPQNPVTYEVSWNAFTALAVTYLGTSTFSNILIDNAGAVLQTEDDPTDVQMRENIYLARLGHTDLTAVQSIVPKYSAAQSPMSQLNGLINFIGLINSGNVISANGANLSINKSAGQLHGKGVNYATSTQTPNTVSIASATAPTIRRRTQTGVGTSSTSLDVGNYDVAGTITALSGTKYTNQRVFLFTNGNIVVQYGQVQYTTMTLAIAGVETEEFIIFPNLTDAALIGVISVRSTATDLSDPAQAYFGLVSKFGELGFGSGGAGTYNSWTAAADTGTPAVINDGETLTTAGGFGVNTSISGNTITVEADTAQVATQYDLSSYLPIIGGRLTGTGGAGFIGFPTQSSVPATPANGFSIFGDNTGRFSWIQTDGYLRTLISPTAVADRGYRFQNKSYTLADSADVANNITSIAANYLATSNGTNLVARNLFDNNTAVSILNSKPFIPGQWTTAGRPTGVNGYVGFNTTFNWLDIYSSSGWFSPARAATTGGAFTAGYIPFGGTGGLTESANLSFSSSILSLTGNRSTFTSESALVKSHEYLFFESVGTTVNQYEDVFNVITSNGGRGAVVEVQVADGTNSLHTSSYIVLTGDPGTTNWYVAPAFNINNVLSNDIRLDVRNDGAAFRTYFRLRRVGGATVANVAVRVRVLSSANVVTVERASGTGTTTVPTLIWPLGNQITQAGGFVGIGTTTPTYGVEIVKNPALSTAGLILKTSPESTTAKEVENIYYETIGAAGAYEDVFSVVTSNNARGAVVQIQVAEGNSANYFSQTYFAHCNEVGNTNYHQLIPIFSTSSEFVIDAKHDPALFQTFFRLRRVSGSGSRNCAIKVRVLSNSNSDILVRLTTSGTVAAPTTFFPFSNYIYQGGNKAGLFTLAPNYVFDITSTDAFGLPRGTVAQRPTIVASTTPFRYNTDSTTLEYGESVGTWRQLATRSYARSLVSALPNYTFNYGLNGTTTIDVDTAIIATWDTDANTYATPFSPTLTGLFKYTYRSGSTRFNEIGMNVGSKDATSSNYVNVFSYKFTGKDTTTNTPISGFNTEGIDYYRFGVQKVARLAVSLPSSSVNGAIQYSPFLFLETTTATQKYRIILDSLYGISFRLGANSLLNSSATDLHFPKSDPIITNGRKQIMTFTGTGTTATPAFDTLGFGLTKETAQIKVDVTKIATREQALVRDTFTADADFTMSATLLSTCQELFVSAEVTSSHTDTVNVILPLPSSTYANKKIHVFADDDNSTWWVAVKTLLGNGLYLGNPSGTKPAATNYVAVSTSAGFSGFTYTFTCTRRSTGTYHWVLSIQN